MPIASVSKWFVALAVGILVDRGDLQFESTIDQFLPTFPNGEAISINDLLRHTSEIPDLYVHPLLQGRLCEQFLSESDVLEVIFEIAHSSSLQKYDKSFNYSNSNYILLGFLIGIVTGKSMAEALRDFVLLPCGMTGAHTSWSGTPKDFPTRSLLTTENGPVDYLAHQKVKQLHLEAHFSDGNIVLTPQDIDSFFRATCGRALVTENTWAKLTTPSSRRNDYACGIRQISTLSGVLLCHEGFWLGFQSGLCFLEDGSRGFFAFDTLNDPQNPNVFSEFFSNQIKSEFGI